MPTNADRLLLLADHIKLSLLERSRAISLKLEPNTADAYITRSLETLRQGIDSLEQEQTRLEQQAELPSKALRDREDTLVKLRSQYDTLTSQFESPSGTSSASSKSNTIDLSNVTSKTALDPNSLPYSDDPESHPHHHAAARGLYTDDDSASTAAKSRLLGDDLNGDLSSSASANRKSKQVRFSDSLVDTDDLSNQQVMTVHRQIMEEQDDTLDRLSESIGRQRELSIQIGDELDSQGELLDDLDDGVDRAQRRLTGARKRLDTFARKAKDNGSMITIAILIIVLVLLIALLK
ncbi:Syntaxin-61 [Arthrobotrys entomopaga]|nr:Syntaxin-61 [Arthrobotrys entomopaga]